MKLQLSFTLNGMPVECLADAHMRLIDVLRDQLGQTGTKEGCGAGECGACTVLVDGRSVNSCLMLAPEVEGCEVLTIEGLSERPGQLHPVQRAFVEQGGVQCGFCTPGMILTSVALLDENREPSDAEIRDALTGNLCRCTGYTQILEAIRRARELLREEALQ